MSEPSGSPDGEPAMREFPGWARAAGAEVLPDDTTDDTAAGWGERADDNDERLTRERPPHWE